MSVVVSMVFTCGAAVVVSGTVIETWFDKPGMAVSMKVLSMLVERNIYNIFYRMFYLLDRRQSTNLRKDTIYIRIHSINKNYRRRHIFSTYSVF